MQNLYGTILALFFGGGGQLPRMCLHKFAHFSNKTWTFWYHSNQNVYQTNSPEFEVGDGKNYQCPKKSFWFLSRSFWREPWHCSADTKGPLSVNLPELPIRNSEEFEVGNRKNYLHPRKSPIFFSRSVKILVRMVMPSCTGKSTLNIRVLHRPCFRSRKASKDALPSKNPFYYRRGRCGAPFLHSTNSKAIKLDGGRNSPIRM